MAASLPLVFNAPRRGMPPRHLADLDSAERRRPRSRSWVCPAFRADQLARHYFGRLTRDPDDDDRPPRGRARAGRRGAAPAAAHPGRAPGLRRRHHPQDAVAAHDGTLLESVLMRYPDRATLCISSQAGCGMACPFCATGQGGLQRNLSTAEIVDQVRAAAAALRDGDVPAARAGCPTSSSWAWASRWPTTSAWSPRCAGSPRPRPDGLGLSQRSVTVSTVGLAPGDPQARRRGPAGHARGVAAHAGRRAARHPGAGQQPLDGGRGARRRPLLRRHDRPPRVDRVRADPRRQRPAVARRPAGQAAAQARSGRWCT